MSVRAYRCHGVPWRFTVKGTTMKLLTSEKIKEAIGNIGKKGAALAALIHSTAVQTILHAQKHGDATLADELVKTLRDTMPGYVWQGLVLWYRKNSPIAWDEKGNVYVLKADEKGYKPYNPEQAEANPAAAAKEVTARTDTKIEPFSIALIKKRIAGMVTQLEKAQADGGRGVVGDPATIKLFINSVVAFADKVSVVDTAQEKTEGAPESETVVNETKAKGRKAA